MAEDGAAAPGIEEMWTMLAAAQERIGTAEREAMDVPAATQVLIESLQAELVAATDAASAHEADLAAMRGEIESSDARLREAAARYRDLAVRAEPDLPPDLITGDSIAAIDASVETARAIAGRIRSHIERQAQTARVPAGSPARGAADLSALSPEQKIRFGLERRT